VTYTRVRNPFDSTNSATPSNQTFSSWCWMGDYAQLSVQVVNNSVVTMYGSNRDLWKITPTSVDTLSVITAIAATGVYKVEPGMGWVQFQRSTSTQTVSYIGQERG